MLRRSTVKLALTGALMLLLLGGLQGCGQDPTGPSQVDGGGCVWIAGQIHCTG